MKRLLLLALPCLASAHVFARSAAVCPTLPAGSGLEWSYSEGVDFDVCRAHAPDSDDVAFGIYLGNHPNFHPERSTRIDEGNVGGHRVTWYREGPDRSDSAFSRQTLLMIDKEQSYVAHIWVTANTKQQLLDRLSVLKRMVFKGL